MTYIIMPALPVIVTHQSPFCHHQSKQFKAVYVIQKESLRVGGWGGYVALLSSNPR